MSKLIQRIERLNKDAPAPMGFGAAARRQPMPTMVLLAATAEPEAVANANGVALDAVIFRGDGVDGAAAAKAMQALPDVPWGAQANTLSQGEVSALVEAGADFVSLTGLTSALDALRDEDVGKLLVVPVDLKEEHARSLEVMPVDAVMYADAVASPLTLEVLMHLATARCEIGRPFLLPVHGALTAWELECLREIGVEGVVADLETTNAEGLQALSDAIRGLPRRKSRGESLSATLPRLGGRARPQHDDDDDDFDPDDPDDLP
ncbi:MAG: hypothetical protein OXT51_04890 [Chloroflexota bacterium]|nr:hypothetical protein [Chloroflexota bacterium]